MANFTLNTYTLKRKILKFTDKISNRLSKPERKFVTDIAYGMLAGGSCLLTDVVKPDGYKSEALGIVRDGSERKAGKNVYKKGYHVMEACVLTGSNHPVSIFSKIHSSWKKIISLQTRLLFGQWNKVSLSLENAPLPWIVVTTITRCS